MANHTHILVRSLVVLLSLVLVSVSVSLAKEQSKRASDNRDEQLLNQPAKKSDVSQAKIDTKVSRADSSNVPVSPQQASAVADSAVTAQKQLLGETITWQVLAVSHDRASDGSLTLSHSIGQVLTGVSSAPAMSLREGFWQSFAGTSGEVCCGEFTGGVTGNVDDSPDGFVDLGDLLYLGAATFLGGPPVACPAKANTDGDPDCIIDMGDMLWLGLAAFLGGPPNAECMPQCE